MRNSICIYLFVLVLGLPGCNDSSVQPVSQDSLNKSQLEPVLPVLESSISIRFISESEYEVTGQIVSLGRKPIIEYGHTWSTLVNPSSAEFSTQFGARENTGTFKSRLAHLDPESKYYVRAYAITVVGTVFGESVELTP